MIREAGVGRLTGLAAIVLCGVLVSCVDHGLDDLDQFMAETRARPGGVVELIPTFISYDAFAYEATTIRSPFDRPVDSEGLASLSLRLGVRPEAQRLRVYLEGFTLDSLMMVGSLRRSGTDWALIKDPDGGVHRVKRGDYLGRDHGRVVDMGSGYVAVIEIVPDGTEDGWVERPRTIELIGK
ncbi:MAG: pilus assembly protein PilP [Luminiphilus sp.]|nr:pilus assembly protein PilP [Luminiphilus sp.]